MTEGVFDLEAHWDELTAAICDGCPHVKKTVYGYGIEREEETDCPLDFSPELVFDGGNEITCRLRFK